MASASKPASSTERTQVERDIYATPQTPSEATPDPAIKPRSEKPIPLAPFAEERGRCIGPVGAYCALCTKPMQDHTQGKSCGMWDVGGGNRSVDIVGCWGCLLLTLQEEGRRGDHPSDCPRLWGYSMVCIGKNIAICPQNPQFLGVKRVLCTNAPRWSNQWPIELGWN